MQYAIFVVGLYIFGTHAADIEATLAGIFVFATDVVVLIFSSQFFGVLQWSDNHH